MKSKYLILTFCIFISCKKEMMARVSSSELNSIEVETSTDTIKFKELGNKLLINFNFPSEWKVNTYHDENIVLSKSDIESNKQWSNGNYFNKNKGKKIFSLKKYFLTDYIKSDSLLNGSKLDSIFVLDSIITANKKILFIKTFSTLNDKKIEEPLLVHKIDIILIDKTSFIKSANLYLEIDYPFLSKITIGYLSNKGDLTQKKFEIDEEKIYYKGIKVIDCNKYFNSPSKSINTKLISIQFQGKFSSTVETEATTSGMASITYNFIIQNNKVSLETNTFHEPISCNGQYKALEKGNTLELYYIGNDQNCKNTKPSFIIKIEKNKYFIKGVGGEGTFNGWIKLIKI